MKKIILSVIGGFASCAIMNAQAVFGPFTAASWQLGGNNNPAPIRNVIGPTWSSALAVKPQIWFTTGTTASGIYRMMINDGGTAITDGYIGIGDNLPANFVPQARLHAHQASGVNFMKFTTATTGSVGNVGFDVGTTNTGVGFLRAWSVGQPIQFANNSGSPGLVNEKMRITANVSATQNGYVGINEPNPLFHVDAKTPAHPSFELIYSGRVSDVAGGRVGFYNSSPVNGRMVPAMFGVADVAETNSALRVIGSIDASQDIAANTAPITNFVSGRGLTFPAGVGPNTALLRNLFAWSNAGSINMLMNNVGRVRIMESLVAGTNVPGNRLEITSSLADPYGLTGSGLRFTNLTCANTPLAQCNPANPIFLSVDALGNVIPVGAPVASPAFLGGLCSSVLPIQPADAGVNLANNNFYFDGNFNGVNRNNVFLGVPCNTIPLGKFHVEQSSNTTTGSTGIYVKNTDAAGLGVVHGINVEVPGVVGNSTGYVGVKATVSGEKDNVAIEGISNGLSALGNENRGGRFISSNSNFRDIGVSGFAIGTATNIGGEFKANNSGGATYNLAIEAMANNFGTGVQLNIGVLAYANSNSPGSNAVNNIGVAGISSTLTGSGTNDYGVYGESTTGFGGYFVGGVTSGPAFSFSDRKIKKDINTIKNGIELLKQLNPVTYQLRTDEFPELHLRKDKQYGFIAQEIEAILPELVTRADKPEIKDSKGNLISKGVELKAVNYDGIIPVLTKAMQEQQVVIDEQQKVNENLQQQINELKTLLMVQSGKTERTNQAVSLSDKNSVVLNQNVPNPFAEQTLISYSIPTNTGKAQLHFYDATNKLIKSVEITEKGEGQVTVFASDLSNGLYTYTLVVDGKIMDTKKMVKNK